MNGKLFVKFHYTRIIYKSYIMSSLNDYNLPKNQKQNNTSTLNQFISLVPKHLRRFIKDGIFLIPSEKLIQNYTGKKQEYLSKIQESKTNSVNNLHKYTSLNPISQQDIYNINQIVGKSLNEYYSKYIQHLKYNDDHLQLFASFAITYDKGHKGLAFHVDDSNYTVNLCLSTSAVGNQVVFNGQLILEPLEDFALIHSGKIPHLTNELTEGERCNVVLWFK